MTAVFLIIHSGITPCAKCHKIKPLVQHTLYNFSFFKITGSSLRCSAGILCDFLIAYLMSWSLVCIIVNR